MEHCRTAKALGHAGAQARLQQLEAREEVADDAGAAFGRRALLKATYARPASERHARTLGARLTALRQFMAGMRGAVVLLGGACLLLGYLVLDIYFFGMGAWRPDPSRVVWGLFGKIHPPKDDSATRVLPAWLRPDVRSVTFSINDLNRQTWSQHRLGDFQGKVVYLQVVDAKHPAVAESIAFLKALDASQDPSFKFFLLYVPALEDGNVASGYTQFALDFAPGLPVGPKSYRPLGVIGTFPMNFVLDRRGRVRQRWTGFSQTLTEAAIKGALAET
jgi:hypothetical protein